MKIKIILPVYKRPEVFREMVAALHLPDWAKVEVIALLSKEDPDFTENLYLCREAGFTIIYVSNNPLSDKINTGVWYAMRDEFDYLMNIDSDTILSARYWDEVKKLFPADLIGMNQVLCVDCYTQDALNVTLTDMVWCAGRLISYDALKKVDLLYTFGLNGGLDGDSEERLKQFGITATIINDCLAVDLKTYTNINTFLGLESLQNERIRIESVDEFGDLPGVCQRIADGRRFY